jgi:predicted MFS family arabinose efflux permease
VPETRPTVAQIPRRLVAVMAVATGVAVANTYYAQPLLATIRRDLHIQAAIAGLIVTVGQIGYAAGLLFLLPLGDLFERRRLVTLTSLCTAIALVAAALAPTAAALLAAVAAIGVTSVVAQILVPFAASLAGDHERGRVVGTVMSGLLLGILLARTVAGYLAELAGWRSVYLVAAAAMVVLAVVLYHELPEFRSDTPLSYRRLLLSVYDLVRAEPVLRRRSCYGAMSFGAFSVLWTSLAFLLAGGPYHYSEGTIGLFGLVGAAGAAMASLAGRLADRGQVRLLTGATSAGLVVAFALISGGAHSLGLLLAGIVVLDLAAQGLHVTNQSQIYRLSSEARSRINAAYMTAYFVGGATGSALSATLYGIDGWRGVSLLGTGFGLAAFALFLAETIGRASRRAPSPDRAPAGPEQAIVSPATAERAG